jgi:hypothetical protein
MWREKGKRESEREKEREKEQLFEKDREQEQEKIRQLEVEREKEREWALQLQKQLESLRLPKTPISFASSCSSLASTTFITLAGSSKESETYTQCCALILELHQQCPHLPNSKTLSPNV